MRVFALLSKLTSKAAVARYRIRATLEFSTSVLSPGLHAVARRSAISARRRLERPESREGTFMNHTERPALVARVPERVARFSDGAANG
jgi:hypothetical protein